MTADDNSEVPTEAHSDAALESRAMDLCRKPFHALLGQMLESAGITTGDVSRIAGVYGTIVETVITASAARTGPVVLGLCGSQRRRSHGDRTTPLR